jgi:two-component system, LytTR family, sensor kinase
MGFINQAIAFLTQNIKENRRSFGLHIVTWFVLLSMNYLFLKLYVIYFDFHFHILIWLLYISIFYISFSFLIPVFLLKKKILMFIACSMILLALSYFINDSINRNQFITIFREGKNYQPGQDLFRHPRDNQFQMGQAKPPFEINRQEVSRPDLERMLKGGPPKPLFGPGFFSIYGLIIVYFASISIRFLQKLRDDDKKESEISKERIATELLYLKQQVNPHFLFNTLNNIYSLSIKNPGITPEAILKVSSILRYTLYKSDNSLALLKDEIEIINTYIDFQKLRFKNSLPVVWEVSGDSDNHKVEPFILLPLVENAFKYGMASQNDSLINIQLTINKDKLKFLISNKKNILAESYFEHPGIGIKNIVRRLDLVYPERHLFQISDKDGKFTVLLEMPLINNS